VLLDHHLHRLRLTGMRPEWARRGHHRLWLLLPSRRRHHRLWLLMLWNMRRLLPVLHASGRSARGKGKSPHGGAASAPLPVPR